MIIYQYVMVRNALKMQEINEKKAFSQRLKQQLLEQNWPVNRPTWLAREFNMRYNGHSISVQTASNWLSGTAIPNQDKLQILAAWLDISTQWLRFGEVSPTPKNCTKKDHKKIQFYLDDLPKKIGLLCPKQKQIIYEIVNEFLSQNE